MRPHAHTHTHTHTHTRDHKCTLKASVCAELMQDRIGSFEVGKDFDALLIKPEVPNGPFDVFYCES